MYFDFSIKGLCGCLLMATASATVAQTPSTPAGSGYPSKAIRFVVGFAAGGPNDTLARLAGARLTETLAVPVTVDNRPGADSIVGTEIVARAPADGYTIAMVSSGGTIHPMGTRGQACETICTIGILALEVVIRLDSQCHESPRCCRTRLLIASFQNRETGR